MREFANKSIVLFFVFVIGCNVTKRSTNSGIGNVIERQVNLDSMVGTPEKRKLLHEYLLKTYWIEENIIYTPYVIVRDSSYHNIGLYNFSQNSAKFAGVHYMFNYKDTVVFVRDRDSVRFSSEVDKFISTYNDRLSPGNKKTLMDEKKNVVAVSLILHTVKQNYFTSKSAR